MSEKHCRVFDSFAHNCYFLLPPGFISIVILARFSPKSSADNEQWPLQSDKKKTLSLLFDSSVLLKDIAVMRHNYHCRRPRISMLFIFPPPPSFPSYFLPFMVPACSETIVTLITLGSGASHKMKCADTHEPLAFAF